jgi:murein DD-endopeptidase MepM/ murein hydrolase activator NlpD
MAAKTKRKFSNYLDDKYRLIIYNDETFKEVWYLKLSKINFITLFLAIVFLLFAGIFSLVAFTRIREMIPGYPDDNIRRTILMNALRLDSLEDEIRKRDVYFKNLNAIISGEEPQDLIPFTDSTREYGSIDFTKSIEDSMLRTQIEEEEEYNLSVIEDKNPPRVGIERMHFFAPIKGHVTYNFSAYENHFGTDIVAGPNEVVKAVLDGTIILASWTVETGYVIEIQHNNNLISVYKHNAELLKKAGDKVRAGDAIAIIGNSGELTTGPHLHFELWFNGSPIDPEEFIIF